MQRRVLPWREFALLLLPCIFLVLAGTYWNRDALIALFTRPPGPPPPVVKPPPFSIKAGSISSKPLQQANASSGGDTEVIVQLAQKNEMVTQASNYFSRRLEAFDGKRTRLVWSGYGGSLLPFLNPQSTMSFGSQGGGPRETRIFRLRDVPVSWGKLTYRFEMLTVRVHGNFSPNYGEKEVTPGEMRRLVKRGGHYLSTEIVLRQPGQVISAPANLKRAPVQLTGIKVFAGGPGTNREYGSRLEITASYGRRPKKPDIFLFMPYLRARTPDGVEIKIRYGSEKAVQTPNGWTFTWSVFLKGAALKPGGKVTAAIDFHEGKYFPAAFQREVIVQKP